MCIQRAEIIGGLQRAALEHHRLVWSSFNLGSCRAGFGCHPPLVLLVSADVLDEAGDTLEWYKAPPPWNSDDAIDEKNLLGRS